MPSSVLCSKSTANKTKALIFKSWQKIAMFHGAGTWTIGRYKEKNYLQRGWLTARKSRKEKLRNTKVEKL